MSGVTETRVIRQMRPSYWLGQKFTRHPASECWPDLNDREFAALKVSIEKDGVTAPIIILDTRIVDGWHRFRAALEIGLDKFISLPVVKLDHAREIPGLIIGNHSGRRHMTKMDISLAIIETRRACGEDFAESNRPAKSKHTPDVDSDSSQSPQEAAQNEPLTENPGITRESVARDAQVSEATARRAIEKAKSGGDPDDVVKAKSAAKAAGKRREQEIQRSNDVAMWKGMSEDLADQVAALEAELAALDESVDIDDAVAEMRKSMDALRKSHEKSARDLTAALERETKLVGQVEYWKTLANKLEDKLSEMSD